jgi:hypothetical protein
MARFALQPHAAPLQIVLPDGSEFLIVLDQVHHDRMCISASKHSDGGIATDLVARPATGNVIVVKADR